MNKYASFLFTSVLITVLNGAMVQAEGGAAGEGATEGRLDGSFVSRVQSLDTVDLRPLPAHDGGRLKPLDTLARETLLFVTGSRKPFGLDALSLFVGLMTEPDAGRLPLIEIRSVELRSLLGFSAKRRFFSIDEILQSSLQQDSAPLIEKQQKNSKSLTEIENATLETFQQVMVAQAVVSGQVLLNAIDFSNLADATQRHARGSVPPELLEKVKLVVGGLSAGRADRGAISDLDKTIRAQSVPELFRPHLDKMGIEVWLYRSHLFWIAAFFYLVAAVLLWRSDMKVAMRRLAKSFLFAALFAHLSGFAIRVYITGFAPVTNMYGTMLWVAFGVALFATVLHRFYRRDGFVAILYAGSALVLVITEGFPLILNPGLDPVVAVLRSNLWLTIHVLTITISYAALTIAMLLGNYGMITHSFGTLSEAEWRDLCKDLSHHAYRMIQLGVFLLTVGIVLGGVWADYSWGRFWGWDPKETWALIADLGFLAILHARVAGWMTPLGILLASPVAYLLVIMAWYGVNFVLAAGLHSYGFSKGGAMWVGLFVLAQLALVAVSGLKYWFKTRRV